MMKRLLMTVMMVMVFGLETQVDAVSRQIYVQLNVKEQVEAIATKLHISIENTNRSFDRVEKANKRTVKKIKKILSKKGILESDIFVDDYSRYPEEGFISDSVQLKSVMVITVKDPRRVVPLSRVIKSAIDTVVIERVSYDFGSYTLLKNQLTLRLVEQMKERQSYLGNALGVVLTLGAVKEQFSLISVSDDNLSIREAMLSWDVTYFLD